MILNWKWKKLPFNCRLEQLGQLPEKKSLLFQVEKLKKRRRKVENMPFNCSQSGTSWTACRVESANNWIFFRELRLSITSLHFSRAFQIWESGLWRMKAGYQVSKSGKGVFEEGKLVIKYVSTPSTLLEKRATVLVFCVDANPVSWHFAVEIGEWTNKYPVKMVSFGLCPNYTS